MLSVETLPNTMHWPAETGVTQSEEEVSHQLNPPLRIDNLDGRRLGSGGDALTALNDLAGNDAGFGDLDEGPPLVAVSIGVNEKGRATGKA